MGIRHYADTGAGRFIATFACKRGSRLVMRKVKFTVFNNAGATECEEIAVKIAMQLDRWSTGELMSLVKVLGHYIKDEVIPTEPADSRSAFVLQRNSTARKMSAYFVPWLKDTVSDATIQAAITSTALNNPFPFIGNLRLDEDGLFVEATNCPDYHHITLKDTAEIDDNVVVTGENQDDPTADVWSGAE